MDTTTASSLGDTATLFTALRSVHAGARTHLIRLNEQMSVVTEMTRRTQDAAARRELDEISRLLDEVRTLLCGRDTLELGRAVLSFSEGGTVLAQERLAAAAGEVATLLDHCICASARIEFLLVQSAQRLSELEAAEV